MKYRKFNKFEKKEVRSQMLANALHGEGVYLYRNNTGSDLRLPRPTKSGIRSVGPNKEFQGDNYYMQLVKQGFLRLVKEIQSPQAANAVAQEEANVSLNESINEKKENNMEEKLILDQPDTVTTEGKVEHVIKNKNKKLNEEQNENEKKPDVLLNEGPIEGGFVIVGK